LIRQETMVCARFMIFALLALPGLINADKHLEDVYAEHNKIRRKNNLSTLYVDKNLEEMLQRLGYNSNGHRHAQISNLNSYASRVTGIQGIENVATSQNYKHTMQTLFYKGTSPSGRPVKGWMHSPGHKRNILDPSTRYMGCGIGNRPSRIGRNKDWSYTCYFITDYKNGCFQLTTTEEDCDFYRTPQCISKTVYTPSC